MHPTIRCCFLKLFKATALTLALLAMLTSSKLFAANVAIDWSAPSTGQTTFRTFASNDELNGQFTVGALDPKYAANLHNIGIRFLRLHSGTVQYWTTDNAWDPKKIATELNAPYIKACGDSNLIITINVPPRWCRNIDNTINDKKYAAFCAQLVKVVNKDLGHHVEYWQCVNEASSWEEFSGNNWAPMFAMYNACAQAMKAVDPTIKIGGNVMTWYDDSLARAYLAACWPNIDFLSWHLYFTGDKISPPLDGPTIYTKVMKQLPRYDSEAAQARAAIADLRSHGFNDGHPILLDLDEFNMGYDYTAAGWGQDMYPGAAFFGASLTHMAHDRYDISANWSAKEGYYGFTDMDDKMRPAAYVYDFANHNLIGAMASSTTDDPDIECLAVDGGANASGDKHAIMLTNKYYEPKTITLEHGLSMFGREAHITTIDHTGMHSSVRTLSSFSTEFVMQGFSVTMITMP